MSDTESVGLDIFSSPGVSPRGGKEEYEESKEDRMECGGTEAMSDDKGDSDKSDFSHHE